MSAFVVNRDSINSFLEAFFLHPFSRSVLFPCRSTVWLINRFRQEAYPPLHSVVFGLLAEGVVAILRLKNINLDADAVYMMGVSFLSTKFLTRWACFLTSVFSLATFSLSSEYHIGRISIDRRGGALIPVVQSAVQLGFFFADAEFLGRRQDRTTIASLIKSSSEYVA